MHLVAKLNENLTYVGFCHTDGRTAEDDYDNFIVRDPHVAH